MPDRDLKYKIGISLIPNVGPVVARRLIAYLGSIEAVFRERKDRLLKIPGIGKVIAGSVVFQDVLSRAEEEVKFIERNEITPVFYLDDDYPERLRLCEDAPVILFTKGITGFNSKKIISIVGTRKATTYGKEICRKFIKDIAASHPGMIIVSGLAYGIDVTAHKAALDNGLQTIAVLGHGLDTIYPPLHTHVAEAITHQGALVTDFMSKTLPDRQNFVKRNRIIAGLADATIIIESGLKGGSLITAEMAGSYNRDVFAFPGRVNDPASIGCNWLIKNNKAGLIESLQDLEYFMRWDQTTKVPSDGQHTLFPELTSDEKAILELLKENGDLEIDMIVYKSGFQPSMVSAMLLNLEFSGLVRCLPGKVYSLYRPFYQ
ncbi:MAG: DNA-processing protein DprA [Bacteroidia bacterium]|nr:DNA-processing protein DprA [Bacteroidia bacterium]